MACTRFCITIRTAAALLSLEAIAPAHAQGTGDSPYSAFGFGDLLSTGQATQVLMGGTGVAYTEEYSVVLGNPASYAGMYRPVFEAAVAARTTRFVSSAGDARRKDAGLAGINIGVPFGRGRWGLALGLAPYSDVGYTTTEQQAFDGGTVKHTYTGSGGLDRAFFGLSRALYQQRSDSVGNRGTRVLLGANFDFIFGSIEQTRDAVYPLGASFSNLRAFSSLVLRAPTADVGLLWEGDLTRRATKEQDNWRYTIGLTAQLPVTFSARSTGVVGSYTVASGVETFRDTIVPPWDDKGTVSLPVGLGLGFGIVNERWMITAEARMRDWSATDVDVTGYALPAPLRNSITYAVGARYRPDDEGGLFQRCYYRMGARYGDDYLQVLGSGLSKWAVTGGLSLPVNAAQTNSYLHLGAELGRRGTTTDGLIREQYATLWIGISLAPWRGERWFTPPKIL